MTFSKGILFVGFLNKSDKKVAKMSRPSNIRRKKELTKETVFFFRFRFVHYNRISNQIFFEILLTDTFMLCFIRCFVTVQ